MTEQSDKPGYPGSINAQPTANGDASAAARSEIRADSTGVRPVPQAAPKTTRKRNLLIGMLGVAVLAVLLVFGIPWVEEMLNTVSTDDAFVNGHVTFVAPRVADRSPAFWWTTTTVCTRAISSPSWTRSRTGSRSPRSRRRSTPRRPTCRQPPRRCAAIEAQARSRRWNLQRAMEDVDNQVALLHARVAAVDKSKAALTLAQARIRSGAAARRQGRYAACRSTTGGKRR